MHPAWSVIVFITVSDAAQGLVVLPAFVALAALGWLTLQFSGAGAPWYRWPPC